MFEVGDFIVYESRGICKVEDVTELNLPNATKGQKYYENYQKSNKKAVSWYFIQFCIEYSIKLLY